MVKIQQSLHQIPVAATIVFGLWSQMGAQSIVPIFKQIGSGVSGPQGVRKWPPPLSRNIALTIVLNVLNRDTSAENRAPARGHISVVAARASLTNAVIYVLSCTRNS